MPIQRIDPASLAPYPTSSHVIKDGNTVYVSGQVARDNEGKTVGVGNAEAQVHQVFKNLQEALASAGCSLSSVVKMNTYMTNREDLGALQSVKAQYMSAQDRPTSTLVFCSGLANPDFLLEVEVIAVAP